VGVLNKQKEQTPEHNQVEDHQIHSSMGVLKETQTPEHIQVEDHQTHSSMGVLKTQKEETPVSHIQVEDLENTLVEDLENNQVEDLEHIQVEGHFENIQMEARFENIQKEDHTLELHNSLVELSTQEAVLHGDHNKGHHSQEVDNDMEDNFQWVDHDNLAVDDHLDVFGE